MTAKLFVVLAVAAVFAFLLASVALALAVLGKEDPRVWAENARVSRLATVFQYSMITAVVLGATAWIVQP